MAGLSREFLRETRSLFFNVRLPIEDRFFDRDYSLQSQVQAIRDISHDPTLREAIKLKDGRTITALEMQLEYLECATRYVDSISADPATKNVLARWANVLTKLESDPMQR